MQLSRYIHCFHAFVLLLASLSNALPITVSLKYIVLMAEKFQWLPDLLTSWYFNSVYGQNAAYFLLSNQE